MMEVALCRTSYRLLSKEAKHRRVAADGEVYTLRESAHPYMDYFGSENGALRGNNTISWQTIPGITSG